MESINGLVWLPMQSAQLSRLEEILRGAQVVVPGNYNDDFGPSLVEYISSARLGGVEFRALFDRNLISPIASLASGQKVSDDPEQARLTRLACAALCFCIWGEIVVEPAMALYEFASATGNDAAQKELAWFRIADNSDPMHLLAVALGDEHCLPLSHLDEVAKDPGVMAMKSKETNFRKTLNLWRPNYLCVLKTLELVRKCPTPADAARELMAWQARESFYNAPAFLYCLAAISHRPPKGGMLKGVRSQNAMTLKRGAMNATWDICLLQQFGGFVTAPRSPSWSLWSDDYALRYIARMLFVSADESNHEQLQTFYVSSWGKDGEALANHYLQLAEDAKLGSEFRRQRTHEAFSRVESDISALELRLGISKL